MLLSLGVVILLGKGDWMINTISSKDKYNPYRLRLVSAITIFVSAIGLLIMTLVGGSEAVVSAILIPIVAVMVILMETWARY